MERIPILKTYKLYIGGQFPRTVSGRTYPIELQNNRHVNVCLASKKDLRNAVVAARKASGTWANKSAFNRSQILYRLAEIIESRKTQFIEELQLQGLGHPAAEEEIHAAIDCLVYYAGWCDKYQQVFSSVNPVASSFMNFSTYEAVGVVGVIAPQSTSLIGLIQIVAPIISGGNTVVILASETKPLCSITLGEAIQTSDVPAGVINVLTGSVEELAIDFAQHMDINALFYGGENPTITQVNHREGAQTVKRIRVVSDPTELHENPYLIIDFQELKTTWHPVEKMGGNGTGY